MLINLAYQQWKEKPCKLTEDQLGSALFNYAKAIVSSEFGNRTHFLEDAVGEASHKVYSNLSNFDPQKAQFNTWVHTIVYNTCIDMLRAKSALKEQKLVNEEDFGYEHRFIKKFSLTQLTKKLNFQEKWMLQAKLDGVSDTEIAELLFISKSNAKIRWVRLMRKLRTLVGGNHAG